MCDTFVNNARTYFKPTRMSTIGWERLSSWAADVSRLQAFVVTGSGELHVPAGKLMQLPPLRMLGARSFLYFDRRYVHKDVRAS